MTSEPQAENSSGQPHAAAHRNLAAKYRPADFGQMVGQEVITRTLGNSLKLGKIAHAYLFYGPRGCGKTTSARILAKALNCTGGGNAKPTDKPCGTCISCVEISRSSDMDVLEMDAASNTKVEQVREAIIDTVSLSPARDRYKVFILDEVHMLSNSSFNALLKTIEEPPPHVVFILATTERNKLPATILSRCQGFRVKPFSPEQIAGRLAHVAKEEKLDISKDALLLIAKSSGGVMRDALTLLDRALSYSQGKIDAAMLAEMLGFLPEELVSRAVSAMLARDAQALHAVFKTVQSEGYEIPAVLRDIKNAFAGLFFQRLDPESGEPFAGAARLAAGRTPAELSNFARRLGRLADEIRFSDAPAVAAEVGVFTVMEAVPDIEGYTRRLEAMENRLSGAPEDAPHPQKTAAAAPPVPATSPTAPKSAAPAPLPPLQQPKLSKPAALPPLPPLTPAVKEPPAAYCAPAQAAPPRTAAEYTADGVLWKKLLDQLEQKHPMLHNYLSEGHVEFSPAGWTVSLSDNFSAQSAERNIPQIAGIIKELSGRDIKVKFTTGAAKQSKPHFEEISSVPAREEETEVSAISDDEPLAPEGAAWQDIDSPADPSADPAVRKVLKLFHGKVVKTSQDEKH
ncbi:MAG: DNA polymerase III subunit gamma/tau [Elusimicrobiales bacterium]|nr:DNA polymerase III subunit gamma/tau [Elusimicrobiales bacterium]